MSGATGPGWGPFLLAVAMFFASHALPARPAIRRRLTAAVGETPYLVGYSLLSLAVLAWLIVAAGRAPHVPLWNPAPWQMWVPALAMPLACLLTAFGIGAACPFSIAGGPPEAFDPEHPGIAGVTRHPLLWAMLLWAGSHMLPNGDLAHVLLFGAFAGFAGFGMVMLDRRRQRAWGAAEWARLARRTGIVPGAALLTGRWRPGGWPDRRRLALALLLWIGLLALHPSVIGVSPWPV